ncbi:aminoglycoside phosphotransferase family protein [Kaistia geumhonensis]|uniref:Aminoglycoside phosphotransferase (APT) family kinase protein n=1 Tax=Kaistia geumhonensis TaxID=410839 RepID=A0ABU0M3X9_9HYPH|nr:aminoglycoside phosphotransferase family protein [Kaistia geumhonensis]MCX5479117.1 aminoglycoside phosphotransferase family protein [Kaistia geumhonensis]MDQ0515663.1 aminoglycoside phosphotransferase (APT) family kinase protein [Kaistia geumhonensis]
MQGHEDGAASSGAGDDVEAFEPRARRLVVGLGLAREDEIRGAEPLAGGVASDIGVVDLGDRKVCVKFALAKLKVAAEWRAPVRRGRAEYAWLAFAGSVVPDAVPRLFGWSEAENGFAMDYVGGDGVRLWKACLLAGSPPAGEAEAVGDRLGRIHAASTRPGFDDAPFRNADDFRALRIEPYLLFAAGRHPDLAKTLATLAGGLDLARTVLVHGDISPKNILLAPTGPILLDAECATMGDAAFDVAFCLNHLVLKAVHVRPMRAPLLASAAEFWRSYAAHVDFEDVDTLERRIAALLPALMLARIDGKSPVEYLSEPERRTVRAIAAALIPSPPHRLDDLLTRIGTDLDHHG